MKIIKKCHHDFFFGNHQAENYRDMVTYLVQYKSVGCNISLKVHFLDSD